MLSYAGYSTTGCASSMTPSSSIRCRCYAGHSAPLPLVNVRPSPNGSPAAPRVPIGRVTRSSTSNWQQPRWLPSISFWASVMVEPSVTERQARMRRWRMLLGEASADELAASLSREEQQMDAALGALYDADDEEAIDAPRRSSGLGSSAPRVARWLG